MLRILLAHMCAVVCATILLAATAGCSSKPAQEEKPGRAAPHNKLHTACTRCGSTDTEVTDSRPRVNPVVELRRRYHLCRSCKRSFRTDTPA